MVAFRTSDRVVCSIGLGDVRDDAKTPITPPIEIQSYTLHTGPSRHQAYRQWTTVPVPVSRLRAVILGTICLRLRDQQRCLSTHHNRRQDGQPQRSQPARIVGRHVLVEPRTTAVIGAEAWIYKIKPTHRDDNPLNQTPGHNLRLFMQTCRSSNFSKTAILEGKGGGGMGYAGRGIMWWYTSRLKSAGAYCRDGAKHWTNSGRDCRTRDHERTLLALVMFRFTKAGGNSI